MTKNIKANKTVYMELLRILACYLVLFNHTSSHVVDYSLAQFSLNGAFATLLLLICKMAVPLFLMISGANLIKKQDSAKKSVHRIVKTFCIILFSSLLYHLYFHKSFSINQFIEELYNGNAFTAVWYLYPYLSILIILPVLQSITIKKAHYIYILVLYCLTQGLFPIMNTYFGVPSPQPRLFSAFPADYLVLFLLGDFLENRLEEKYYTKKYSLYAWITFVATLGVSYFLAMWQLFSTGEFNHYNIYNKNYFTFTIILSGCIFYLAKYYLKNPLPRFLSQSIIALGNATLGIYLLGDFLRYELVDIFEKFSRITGPLMGTLIFDGVIFVVGFVMTFVVQKMVRFINRYRTKSAKK